MMLCALGHEVGHLIFMNIEDGYLMENYVDDDFEKTGEIKTRPVLLRREGTPAEGR